MDTKNEGLVRLLDQAIALANERISAIRSGSETSVEGIEQIISHLQYRRDEASTSGFPVYDSYLTLGLGRLALEYDLPNSELLQKIDEIEQYFLLHFVLASTV